MNPDANEIVDEGLSLGARLFLGGICALIGAMMVLIASPEEGAKKLFFYGFAAFCFLIAFASVARGRVGQFLGSTIGTLIFAIGVWYFASLVSSGQNISPTRSEPSVLNALLFLLFVGLPGATYAWSARFGFRKSP